jgi:hypothetical protein
MKRNIRYVVKNLALMALVGFLVGVSVFLHEWFKPKRNIAREKPAFVLTVAELAQDFSRDAHAAEVKYLDKVLQVSGTVSTKEVDAYNNVNLFFTTDEAEVQVSFLGGDNTEAADMEQGDQVALKGNYTGYSIDDIFGMQVKLNNGYIVK